MPIIGRDDVVVITTGGALRATAAMEASRGDVGLAKAGAPGGDVPSSDGDLVSRMAKTRRDLKVWETAFAKTHGRQPSKEDAAAAPGVKEMYGAYRSLKAKLDKENTLGKAVCVAKPTDPNVARSGGRPLLDAARRDVKSPGKSVANLKPKPTSKPSRVPIKSRLPIANDSSDDEGDVIDATPVKNRAPTRVQPMRAAKSPSKTPEIKKDASPKRARKLPRQTRKSSPKAARALFPSALAHASEGDTLPPINKPMNKTKQKPISNPFGRLAGGFGDGGGFAKIAQERLALTKGENTKAPQFEPLLCDARGVLDNGVLDLGGTKEKMTLSNFLAQEPKNRKTHISAVNKLGVEAPSVSGRKTTVVPTNTSVGKQHLVKPTSSVPNASTRRNDSPDEDEMLAAMEADIGDIGGGADFEEEEDFDAAEARAAAAAARRREAAAARRREKETALQDGDETKSKNNGDDDEDYVASSDDDFAITTTRRKRKRNGDGAVGTKEATGTRTRKTKTAPKQTAEPTGPTTQEERPMTGRERAEARNKAVAAAAAATKKKPSGGKAKPAEASDWRAAGDEAPDRAPAVTKKKAQSKTSKGNFVKLNMKKTWKSHGVKGGVKKSSGASHRYGGGAQSWNKGVGRRKVAPQPGDKEQSVWSAGDWADRKKAQETPAEEKKRALREAEEDKLEASQPGAKEAAAAREAFLETLEKPSKELEEACAECFADPSEVNLTAILKRCFGFSSFKPGQLPVIQRVLKGKSTLALLPTGAGKSLTYQLPALLFPGLTLVVSPLLALMADQLRGLPPALPGAALRSDQPMSHLFAVLDEMRAGTLKVLFVSPERLLNERFLHDLKFVPGGVSCAVVDEAHCVSEWSHNFRPAYHRLGAILRQRLQVSGPVLALTATATARTETSLRKTLQIPKQGAFRNDAIRGNLILSAMRVPASSREATLKHLLQKDPLHGIGSVIVYVAFQNQAETVAAYLQTSGVNAKAYHAGQEPKDRTRTQAQFFSGAVRVVVATVAFGMGLDKADVRCVVNYSLPRSPEAYIQQAGRAGRDGQPARCVSFIDEHDFVRLRSLSFTDGVDSNAVHKLLETVFLGKDKKAKNGLKTLGEGGGTTVDDTSGTTSHPTQSTAVGALIVQQLEREMDMRGEVIETVLSCLELWSVRKIEQVVSKGEGGEGGTVNDGIDADTMDSDTDSMDPSSADPSQAGLIRVLPDMRATCELSLHCGGGVENLAQKCPLVQAVLDIAPKPRSGTYRFSVAAAARHMKAGLEEVQNQLQLLSQNGEAAYRLSDRAVGYEILKAPPVDLHPLAVALTDHLTNVEKSAVTKLDTVYAALERAANAESDEAQSASLRVTLEAYLGGDGRKEGTSPVTDDLDLSAVITCDVPRGLVQDVKELLTHRSGGKAGGAGCMSARAVARVLHGLTSPAYPAQEWRRKEKAGHLWEKHAKVSFEVIMKVASEELLAMRGVVRKK